MKTKRFISLALALIMVLGSLGLVAADTAEDPYARIVENGIFVGDDGDLMLDKTFTRAEFAVVALRLMGEGFTDEETVALDISSTFEDVDADAWYAPYIGRAQEKGLVEGDANKYLPGDDVSYVEALTIVMRALGYIDGEDLVNYPDGFYAKAAQLGLADVAIDAKTKIKREVIADTLEVALDLELKDSDVTLAEKLGVEDVVAPGTLQVVSVKAASAKSFEVEFNQAVSEEDEVTFAVKRGNSTVTLTTTWNEDKTVATLSSSTTFPEAVFKVSVMKGEEEIISENIAITAQKVADIKFTSDKVAVTLGGTTAPGYVTYVAYDQYGNDVTSTYLANNLTFSTGVGSAIGKNGLITITPGGGQPPLLQYQSISIIVYDSNTGLSKTATLPTSTAVGTLSSFEISLPEGGLNLVDGDITSVYYLDYIAKDLSGNITTDYELIEKGLIFSSGTDLIVSAPGYVSAKLVKDPNNTNKAAIEVKAVNAGAGIAMDMPITITAMTYTGGSTSVQTTLAKSKVIDSITLLAPTETVAAGESPEIKYEAYDQHGNRITRYNDIKGKISENGFTVTRKVDGTAKFTMIAAGKGMANLSTVVSGTGKMSTLTINVQDPAVPSKLVFDTSKKEYKAAAMEIGSTQTFTLGDSKSPIVVYDQYDRVMDSPKIISAFNNGTNYYVVVTSTSNAVGVIHQDASAAPKTNLGTSTDKVVLSADNAGTANIQVELWKSGAAKPESTASSSFATILTGDIVDYTINEFAKPIYASIIGAGTAKQEKYAAGVTIFGKTNSGAKVLLAGSPIISTSVSNGADFNVLVGSGAYNAVKVTANSLVADPAARTSVSTQVTVNVFHNGKVNALKTNLTASSVAPVAEKLEAKETKEDKITLTKSQFNSLSGKSVAEFDAAGVATTKADFYFKVTDSYETNGMIPAHFNVDIQDGSGNPGRSVFTLGADGIVAAGANGVAGDKVYVTAITNNGLIKTVEITIIP